MCSYSQNTLTCDPINIQSSPWYVQLLITAKSDLGSNTYNWTIRVEDVNQPPQFGSQTYFFRVSENEAPGTVVARVVTGSGNESGANVIRVVDPDTAESFGLDTVDVTSMLCVLYVCCEADAKTVTDLLFC